MRISKADLARAESEGVLKPGQADALWNALAIRPSEDARFDTPHVAYYFGALIVIGAMGWYVTDGWKAFSGLELSLIGGAYATGFVLVGRRIWDRPGFRVPAGLLYTMAVCMIPLIVYGLERATGIWPQGDPGSYGEYHVWVKGSWLLMELGTILGGLAALRSRRFPFLTAPIAFSLWYMSMDLTPLLFGRPTFTFDERALVSVCLARSSCSPRTSLICGIDSRTTSRSGATSSACWHSGEVCPQWTARASSPSSCTSW